MAAMPTKFCQFTPEIFALLRCLKSNEINAHPRSISRRQAKISYVCDFYCGAQLSRVLLELVFSHSHIVGLPSFSPSLFGAYL